MTAREIADALIADKAPQATRKQATDLRLSLSPCGSATARRLLGKGRLPAGAWCGRGRSSRR
jgi:hypothetical protein